MVFLQIYFKPDLNMLMVIVVNIIEAFYHFKYFILLQLTVKFNTMVKVPKFYSSRHIISDTMVGNSICTQLFELNHCRFLMYLQKIQFQNNKIIS